jgi:hypothetical protein
MGLAAPLWLLALLPLLPGLWVLHRLRLPAEEFPIVSTLLWRAQATPIQRGALAPKPEPLWLLRGLLCALLVLSLAQPYFARPQPQPATVWLDHSASMFVAESTGSRLAQGASALAQELSQTEFAKVTVRSLSDPALTTELANDHNLEKQLLQFAPVAGAEPKPPPIALLGAGRQHWLLSDGTSASIRQWAAIAPLTRIIPAGVQTNNVGISLLSLRHQGASQVSVLLQLGSVSAINESRELRLVSAGQTLYQSALTLAAGETRTLDIPLANWPGSGLQAQLHPQDAQSLDDRISLPSEQLQPATVAMSGECGAAMIAAIESDRSLRLSPSNLKSPSLQLHCGASYAASTPLLLWPAAGSASQVVSNLPYWSDSAFSAVGIALHPSWIERVPTKGQPTAIPLLLAGGDALIDYDATAKTIRVLFNPANAQLIRQPEFPLLVSALARHLLQAQPVAEPVFKTTPAPIDIRPVDLSHTSRGSVAVTSQNRSTLVPLCMAIATLLLLLDLYLVMRRATSLKEVAL